MLVVFIVPVPFLSDWVGKFFPHAVGVADLMGERYAADNCSASARSKFTFTAKLWISNPSGKREITEVGCRICTEVSGAAEAVAERRKRIKGRVQLSHLFNQ
jgi:hypothetical protein